MSMHGLLQQKHAPVSVHDIEEALAGNLCRCTGYRPILDAFRTFTDDCSSSSNGEGACSQALNGHICGKQEKRDASEDTVACQGHSSGTGCAANGDLEGRGKVNGCNKLEVISNLEVILNSLQESAGTLSLPGA
jgi:hypothetical protein